MSIPAIEIATTAEIEPQQISTFNALRQCLQVAEHVPHTGKSRFDEIDLFRAADFHRVTPVLYQNLQQRKLFNQLSLASQKSLKAKFQANTAKNLWLVQELNDLVQALALNGIEGVPYKGPVLAHQLWGNVGLRQCVDLDLLVRRQDVFRSFDCLTKLGFETANGIGSRELDLHVQYAAELPMKRPGSNLLLELQWDVTSRCFALNLPMEEFWQRLQKVSFSTGEATSFSLEDLFLILSVHGWKHAWSRLIWVGDIVQLLSNNLDWDLILLTATKARAKRIVLLACALAHEITNANLPELIANEINNDLRIAQLGREAALRLEAIRPPRYFEWHCSMLRSRDCRSNQAAQVLGFCLTPGVPEITKATFSKGFRWAYRPLRAGRLLKERMHFKTNFERH